MTFFNCQCFLKCWPFPRRRVTSQVSQSNIMVDHEEQPGIASPSSSGVMIRGGESLESDPRPIIRGINNKRNVHLETDITSSHDTATIRPLQETSSPTDPIDLSRHENHLENTNYENNDHHVVSRNYDDRSTNIPNPKRKRWSPTSLNFLRRMTTSTSTVTNSNKSELAKHTTTSRRLFGQTQRSSLPKGAKLHPIGLYDHLGTEGKLLARTIDLKLVKKWIRDQRKLAPFFEGTMNIVLPVATAVDHKNVENPTSANQETRTISTRDIDIDRDPIECPICLLYYPKDCINRSRCCRQPICTECFLYMSAARCIIPRSSSPSSNSIFSTNTWFPGEIVHLNGRRYWRRRQTAEEQRSIDQFLTCPFCTTPSYGVVYIPDYHSDKLDTNNSNNHYHTGDTNNHGLTKGMESSDTEWKQAEKRVVSCSIKHFVLEEIPSVRASSLIDEQAYYSALLRRGRRQSQARQTLSTDRLAPRDQLELFRRLLNNRTNSSDIPPEFLEQLRRFIEQRGPITESSFNASQRDHLWNLAEELLVMHTIRISTNETSSPNPTSTHSPSSPPPPLSSTTPLSDTTTTNPTHSSVSSEHFP